MKNISVSAREFYVGTVHSDDWRHLVNKNKTDGCGRQWREDAQWCTCLGLH